ncbi:hypothetical protein HN630_00120 [archaeon]|jgi:hypothetical protein|nr:hypothetical protein [archaeon]
MTTESKSKVNAARIMKEESLPSTGERISETALKAFELVLAGFCMAAGGAIFGSLTNNTSRRDQQESDQSQSENVISMKRKTA